MNHLVAILVLISVVPLDAEEGHHLAHKTVLAGNMAAILASVMSIPTAKPTFLSRGTRHAAAQFTDTLTCRTGEHCGGDYSDWYGHYIACYIKNQYGKWVRTGSWDYVNNVTYYT
ncbi:hypothetical protein HELRODRAFT_178122 [Helobdella robusta]|uniref:Uncharacterized protein n=1 Tax=Helobdella robusta TaxID=6412 RepID=T1FCS2_HELRO|nr:hypothetical protein HELRODRAFT_178122 [Helobdella robusta]ESN97335.1 hypothetical protein HELRODRAFT_178122 [Helobdella robusta]